MRPTLGDEVGLSAFDDGAVTYTEVESDPAALDVYRRSWEPIGFRVPVDGTDHRHLSRSDLPCTDETARQRREFPRPTTALELHGDGRRQVLDAAEAPLWAIFDAVLILPRYVGWGLANHAVAVSPDVDYVRFPSGALRESQRRIWLGEGRDGGTPEAEDGGEAEGLMERGEPEVAPEGGADDDAGAP